MYNQIQIGMTEATVLGIVGFRGEQSGRTAAEYLWTYSNVDGSGMTLVFTTTEGVSTVHSLTQVGLR
jgi:hypothetical protein